MHREPNKVIPEVKLFKSSLVKHSTTIMNSEREKGSPCFNLSRAIDDNRVPIIRNQSIYQSNDQFRKSYFFEYRGEKCPGQLIICLRYIQLPCYIFFTFLLIDAMYNLLGKQNIFCYKSAFHKGRLVFKNNPWKQGNDSRCQDLRNNFVGEVAQTYQSHLRKVVRGLNLRNKN